MPGKVDGGTSRNQPLRLNKAKEDREGDEFGRDARAEVVKTEASSVVRITTRWS
jgi:hypothetical protein